tara:strand:+ start:1021 stop:2136 length:1116 start_codon:yes stop_codon:yes gene_type:complete
VGVCANAQTALYNAGDMQLHANAEVGFHTSFINDAPFDQNLGLVGFYGTNFLNIQGTVAPVFYDFEVNADNGVALNIATNVTNSANFIYGDVITPKSQPDIYFGILNNAIYTGESNDSKVNGFTLTTNQANYSFPIGDDQQLRRLELRSESTNLTTKSAYFFENPNAPISFATIFETNETARQLDLVNSREFWKLEGSVPSQIELIWNTRSEIGSLSDILENLLVVGWSKTNQEWEILGNTAVSGDLDSGRIISGTFTPDDYEILTIGSLLVPQDRLTIDNFFLSPNGDGINDTLIIEELELSPNNELRIYDRNGLLVFQKENYTNEFRGISNVEGLVINREQGLPAGIYYYVVKLIDLGSEFQGFLYLAQ